MEQSQNCCYTVIILQKENFIKVMSFSYSVKWLTHPPYKPYSYNFTLYRLPHNAWKKDGKKPSSQTQMKAVRGGGTALHLGRAECATQISFIE